MASKLQRKCLWQMIRHNNRAVFVTGQKSTDWNAGKIKEEFGGGVIVRCSEVVFGGLKANRWIEKETQDYSRELKDRMYIITADGIRAAGRTEPIMMVASIGATELDGSSHRTRTQRVGERE